MDLEQLAQMQLNGRTNYQHLFEDPTRPNPIVIRWNGGDHYEPVLQVHHIPPSIIFFVIFCSLRTLIMVNTLPIIYAN